MEGADESTELWRHPSLTLPLFLFHSYTLSLETFSLTVYLFSTLITSLSLTYYILSLSFTHTLSIFLFDISSYYLSFAHSLSLSSLILSVIHTHSLSLYLTYSLLLSLSLLFTHSSRRGHREAQTRCGPNRSAAVSLESRCSRRRPRLHHLLLLLLLLVVHCEKFLRRTKTVAAVTALCNN